MFGLILLFGLIFLNSGQLPDCRRSSVAMGNAQMRIWWIIYQYTGEYALSRGWVGIIGQDQNGVVYPWPWWLKEGMTHTTTAEDQRHLHTARTSSGVFTPTSTTPASKDHQHHSCPLAPAAPACDQSDPWEHHSYLPIAFLSPFLYHRPTPLHSSASNPVHKQLVALRHAPCPSFPWPEARAVLRVTGSKGGAISTLLFGVLVWWGDRWPGWEWPVAGRFPKAVALHLHYQEMEKLG